MKWHPKRKWLRVKWGNGVTNADIDWKKHSAGYVSHHATIILHPFARLPHNHDDLYEALGHELLHHVFGDNEAFPDRHERKIGQALHDLIVGFKPPRCDCKPAGPKGT